MKHYYTGLTVLSFSRRLASIVLWLFLLSCDGKAGKSFLPDIPGYNGDSKKIFVLHKQLLEISGIAYVDPTVMAAVNDEDGKIFITDFSKKKPKAIDFGPEHDYEDLVLAGSNYFVLESNGNVYTVGVSDPASARKSSFPKKKKVEFESLYTEPGTGNLILVSKEQRLIDDAVVSYRYDPVADTFSSAPHYVIPLKDIKRMMKDYSAECKPSAAAVHPILNKLFIIASVGKVLLICSLEGKVEKVFNMNPDLLSQPEGIAFSPSGDMYIANEGLQGKATIIMFPYKPGSAAAR